MKKLFAFILVFCLLLSGCSSKPYYENTSEDILVTPFYYYLFPDDTKLITEWTNNSDKAIYTYKEFKLEKLTDDRWVTIGTTPNVEFEKTFRTKVSPGNTSSISYDLSIYGVAIKEGITYRISTYFFDADENYYQVYVEFICNEELANKETEERYNALQEEDPKPFVPPEDANIVYLN